MPMKIYLYILSKRFTNFLNVLCHPLGWHVDCNLTGYLLSLELVVKYYPHLTKIYYPKAETILGTGHECKSRGVNLALTKCDFKFLLLRNVSIGGGIFLFNRCFVLNR